MNSRGTQSNDALPFRDGLIPSSANSSQSKAPSQEENLFHPAQRKKEHHEAPKPNLSDRNKPVKVSARDKKSISRNKGGRVEPDRQTVAARKISRDIDSRRTVATSERSSSRVKKSRVSRKRGISFESTNEGFEAGSSMGVVQKGREKKERKREKEDERQESRNQQSRIAESAGGCQAEAFRRNRRTSGWTELQLLTIRRVVSPLQPPTPAAMMFQSLRASVSLLLLLMLDLYLFCILLNGLLTARGGGLSSARSSPVSLGNRSLSLAAAS